MANFICPKCENVIKNVSMVMATLHVDNCKGNTSGGVDTHAKEARKARAAANKKIGDDLADLFIRDLGLLYPISSTEIVTEYEFRKPRKWQFDIAIPTKFIAIEIEGGTWSKSRHTSGKGFLGDMQKYNAAALLGWVVLRYTPAQMARSMAALDVAHLMLQRDGTITDNELIAHYKEKAKG